ncbi:Extra-cytoplasmic solute receptor [Cupriavidus necator]|uniref:Probable extra-cytoplasmic solute receptor n=1 Tax=Cupriavidus necator (strain ATCC 17699 / DSM 428 / KCTC 22496 / NCIMB 10442 / H16 / Stanier 337) TaxID=381666 RepID=Q0K476_CUPNH|nr:tripartite tricarboxylate transporter substrate binding protein [Cupriavidus necator]QCC03122.1 tripartite tricarboxylate transporter substrate binding protein [Cupriavidus necator H16]QQB80179.1 tripartite tricarboxylate transporter substrate binding protein [Cupriavidus necator]WKA44441.1 tripartite tricarboxylate transporter substrate binding protein [Cupriavidus necator]CAJ95198.1 probable extra-cytoplasmic solute receptor [Cupriavidus necator H16]
MKWKAIAGVAMLFCGITARADTYPSRPITFVVPNAAGGAMDSIARTMAETMSKQLGQPIVIDNRPGAGGMLGAQYVARAAPDGYTLLVTTSGPILMAPFLYARVPYDVKRDFTFVSQICDGQLVMAVNTQKVPVKSVREFVSWAQQHKGSVTYGSYGIGSSAHLMAAYFSESNKLEMTHAAYKGEAPMMQDLIGGQIDWGIGTTGTLAPHLKSGRLRALAVMGNQKLAELPDVPTMAEAGFPGAEYRTIGWGGILAPANVPAPVLAKLEQAARAAAQTTAMKARFQVFGMQPLGTTGADFKRDVEATAPVVERLVRLSGARVE